MNNEITQHGFSPLIVYNERDTEQILSSSQTFIKQYFGISIHTHTKERL